MTAIPPEPVHFLLVDDLEENLLALEGLLRRDGLTLLTARSGVDALEMLLKHDVALALVDIQMPGMDGFELAELMRGSERTRRVPIIFLTAGSTDWNRRFRGYEAGAVDFLQKPVEPHILRSKADVFFELFKQRQEVAQQRDELKLATEEITRLLKESRQTSQALQEAHQRKDEFLAMLAHELRNPLAPVRNAVEILRLQGLSETDVEQAREIISRQVSHMARLVDDLLDVARIARGKVRIRTEPCNLADILRQTTEDYRPTLAAAGISLQLEIVDQKIPILGDPVRLAQVVGNLLHNVRKFTPEGGRVDVRVERDLEHHLAIVVVHDTGTGMNESVINRLFEPFSQADQTFDRDKGGLGLGLALVKGLIELHSGTVIAESAGQGLGSTFTLRLPLAEIHRELPDPPQGPGSEQRPDGLRILIVEDNRDAALTLKLLLTLMGHQVIAANDGPAGLAISREFQPDAIISDLGLPGGIDGYELAARIRADSATSEMFLIALSGYGQQDDQQCGTGRRVQSISRETSGSSRTVGNA